MTHEKSEPETFDPKGAQRWHSWLERNHLTRQSVWLVFHRRPSSQPSISYDDALDEALAYGWIDSVIKRIDDQKYARRFTPRRPGSIWSSLNIKRVERLRREGRMTRWGLEAFQIRTGEKSDLERVTQEGARIPEDFRAALKEDARAWALFERMAPSHRKRYLIWIAGAKKPETRKKRIAEAVELVSKNVRNLLK